MLMTIVSAAHKHWRQQRIRAVAGYSAAWVYMKLKFVPLVLAAFVPRCGLAAASAETGAFDAAAKNQHPGRPWVHQGCQVDKFFRFGALGLEHVLPGGVDQRRQDAAGGGPAGRAGGAGVGCLQPRFPG